MSYDYRVLSAEDRTRLRLERIRALEAEICRAELGLEDALSTAEREAILADIDIIRRRLEPHYVKMGLVVDEPVGQGGSGDGALVPPVELPTAG